MKKMWLVAALALALAVTPVLAQDADVEALRAKIAEQEALLNKALENSSMMQAQMAAQAAQLHDINAKMAMSRQHETARPDGVVSLRKNAAVTIGGIVGPRYTYFTGKLESSLELGKTGTAPNEQNAYLPRAGGRTKAEDYQYGDLRVKDAKLDIKIDVNEHVDAFIRLDLQDTNEGRAKVSGLAQNYWLRWKNICNSGFGVLVGRDVLKYGDNQPIGLWAGWNKSVNDTPMTFYTNQGQYPNWDGTKGNGMFAYGNLIPAHTVYDWLRVTQINPYWESHDGKLRFDLTFLQSIDRMSGTDEVKRWERDGTMRYRSINYGVGSAAFRAQWKPMEGLKFTASAMNLYAQNRDGDFWGPEARRSGGDYGVESTRNNSSVNLAFQYRPAFCKRLNVWGQWTHGWNEAWVDDMDSDSANFGAMYDVTECLTLFAQGDYLRVKNRQSERWHKASGWAFYTGFVYKLPYGANFEGGWRHERMNYKDRQGDKHTVYTGDIFYSQVTLAF